MKFNVVVNPYLVSLSSKFYEDLCTSMMSQFQAMRKKCAKKKEIGKKWTRLGRKIDQLEEYTSLSFNLSEEIKQQNEIMYSEH